MQFADIGRSSRSLLASCPARSGGGSVETTFARRTLALAVAAGLATGALACAVGRSETAGADASTLEQVDVGAVEQAGRSLTPAVAPGFIEDARTCRRPLASLVLNATGAPGGTIRIRSGGYLSPAIRLGRSPLRVAVPFPAAFPTGHGQIAIENASDGVDVFLRPGVRVAAGVRTFIAKVTWDPIHPCKGSVNE